MRHSCLLGGCLGGQSTCAKATKAQALPYIATARNLFTVEQLSATDLHKLQLLQLCAAPHNDCQTGVVQHTT